MEDQTHTDELYNVEEGDTVEMVTSDKDGAFEATCTEKVLENADPKSGEVRETRIWKFDAVEHQPVVSIINGLRSAPDDPEFPIHDTVWDSQQGGYMGYVEVLNIY